MTFTSRAVRYGTGSTALKTDRLCTKWPVVFRSSSGELLITPADSLADTLARRILTLLRNYDVYDDFH